MPLCGKGRDSYCGCKHGNPARVLERELDASCMESDAYTVFRIV